MIWKPLSELREINEDISHTYYKSLGKRRKHEYDDLFLRLHDGKVEWSNERYTDPLVFKHDNKEVEIDAELLKTKAGDIVINNRGEFGGYLQLGDNIKYGNFCHAFMFKGRKFILDSLSHMMVSTFRLYEIQDNGNIELIFDKDRLLGDASEICNDISIQLNDCLNPGFELLTTDNGCIYVVCGSGFKRDENKCICDKCIHIIIYDGKEVSTLRLKNLDILCGINSFIKLDEFVYISCDKEVIEYDTLTNEYIILTHLSFSEQYDLTKETYY